MDALGIKEHESDLDLDTTSSYPTTVYFLSYNIKVKVEVRHWFKIDDFLMLI